MHTENLYIAVVKVSSILVQQVALTQKNIYKENLEWHCKAFEVVMEWLKSHLLYWSTFTSITTHHLFVLNYLILMNLKSM